MTQIRRSLLLVAATAALSLVWAAPSFAAPRLDVSAHVTFDREYTWDISKEAAHPSLALRTGQTFAETYTVTVTNTGFEDGNFQASDGIALHGNTKTATSVTAAVSGGITPTVSCPSLPFSGSSLVCTWGPTALPDASARTVTATVGFSDGSSITSSYAFDFTGKDSLPGQPVETNRCVDVVDTYAGLLGNVCADPANPGQTWTFTYTRTIGPYATCGDFEVENTASVSDDPTEPTSDSATVEVDVACPPPPPNDHDKCKPKYGKKHDRDHGRDDDRDRDRAWGHHGKKKHHSKPRHSWHWSGGKWSRH